MVVASKNQNPREGIETEALTKEEASVVFHGFKKPKSPRGD